MRGQRDRCRVRGCPPPLYLQIRPWPDISAVPVNVNPWIDVMVKRMVTVTPPTSHVAIAEHSPFGIKEHPFELLEPMTFAGQWVLLPGSPVR